MLPLRLLEIFSNKSQRKPQSLRLMQLESNLVLMKPKTPFVFHTKTELGVTKDTCWERARLLIACLTNTRGGDTLLDAVILLIKSAYAVEQHGDLRPHGPKCNNVPVLGPNLGIPPVTILTRFTPSYKCYT